MKWDNYISKAKIPEFDPITVKEIKDAFDFQQVRIDVLVAENSELLTDLMEMRDTARLLLDEILRIEEGLILDKMFVEKMDKKLNYNQSIVGIQETNGDVEATLRNELLEEKNRKLSRLLKIDIKEYENLQKIKKHFNNAGYENLGYVKGKIHIRESFIDFLNKMLGK